MYASAPEDRPFNICSLVISARRVGVHSGVYGMIFWQFYWGTSCTILEYVCNKKEKETKIGNESEQIYRTEITIRPVAASIRVKQSRKSGGVARLSYAGSAYKLRSLSTHVHPSFRHNTFRAYGRIRPRGSYIILKEKVHFLHLLLQYFRLALCTAVSSSTRGCFFCFLFIAFACWSRSTYGFG